MGFTSNAKMIRFIVELNAVCSTGPIPSQIGATKVPASPGLSHSIHVEPQLQADTAGKLYGHYVPMVTSLTCFSAHETREAM